MTFEDTNCSLRNDEDFNDFVYTDHQHSKSELINYEIPCIGKFALDYMHLVCCCGSMYLVMFPILER